MMNEEDYIRSKMGNKNPFKVPEGYFEQLSASIINNLPEETECQTIPLADSQSEQKAVVKPLFVRFRPFMYAAACLLVAVFSIAVYFSMSDNDNSRAALAQEGSVVVSDDYMEDYVDDAVDYMMVDNNDIYACLTGE